MCGIAGSYRYRGAAEDPGAVRAMLTQLERRGPDDHGVVAAGPAVLGNRRLAILDLSAAAHQPMQSADGRYWITFNGEIYNHDDVRRELGVERGALRSSGDTEILLLAWAKWGIDALPRLVGQWAFAVLDTAEQHLWLCRDRFGEKPLFYCDGRDGVVFASSLAALLQHPQVPRELDVAALAEYVSLRYVVSPRTVLREVRKVPPGHLVEVRPEGSRERRWWQPSFRARADAPRSRGALVEEFDALFGRACERCLVSDVPVALFLSDGIDSQSIRSALALRRRPLTAYTFRLRDRDSGAPPAAAAPEAGRVVDLEVSRAERVEQMVPAFASLNEPTGDGVALATWMLVRAARPNATVFLCGHGGDEVMGGYRLSQDRFRLAVLHRLAGLPLAWMGAPLDRFLYGSEPLAERRRRLRASAPDAVPAVARYLTHRPLPYQDVCELLGAAPPEPYLHTIDDVYGACAGDMSGLDRMQWVLLRTFLSENILSFADATAMDASAELRMPFLDRDLVEFVLALRWQCRVSRWPGRANTKRLLRWWADGRVPRDVITRRKRPFQAGLIADLLRHDGATVRSRILDVAAVRRALPGVERWLSRPAEVFRGPWEGTLWALLALAIWGERVGVR